MIKVTVGEQKTQKEIPFPKLMINNNGGIVLFEKNKNGTVIKRDPEWCESDAVGSADSEWSMIGFTDFTGSITLQNELP